MMITHMVFLLRVLFGWPLSSSFLSCFFFFIFNFTTPKTRLKFTCSPAYKDELQRASSREDFSFLESSGQISSEFFGR